MQKPFVENASKTNASYMSNKRRYTRPNHVVPDTVEQLQDNSSKHVAAVLSPIHVPVKGHSAQKLTRTDIFMAVMLLVSTGCLVGIVWNISATDRLHQRLLGVENELARPCKDPLMTGLWLDNVEASVSHMDIFSSFTFVAEGGCLLAAGETLNSTEQPSVCSVLARLDPKTSQLEDMLKLMEIVKILRLHEADGGKKARKIQEVTETTSTAIANQTANGVTSKEQVSVSTVALRPISPSPISAASILMTTETSVTSQHPTETTSKGDILTTTLSQTSWPAAPGPSTIGKNSTDFVVAFLPGVNPFYGYRLYVHSYGNGRLYITGHGVNIHRTILNTPKSFSTLPHDVVNFGTGVKSKSFSLHSTVNITVFAYMTDGNGNYLDAFLLLPTYILSTEYIIIAYEPYTKYRSQFLILSTKDETTVEIRLRHYNGSSFVDGNTLTVRLENHESYQYQHEHDLSGTIIRSNHDIAVYAGTTSSFLQAASYQNAFQEQLLPTMVWTNMYIVPHSTPLGRWKVRLVAKQAGTNVSINSEDGINQNIYLSHSGNVFDFFHKKTLAIVSNAPIGVVHFYQRGSSFPSMGTVIPIANYKSRYELFCHASSSTKCVVIIIIPGSAVRGLLLDNKTFTPLALTNVPSPLDIFWTLLVYSSNGYHYLNNTDPTIRFGAMIFNDEIKYRYGYPCGIQ